MLQLLDDNPGIRVGQKYVSSLREFMGSGITSALHFVFSQKDAGQADAFFESLIDGVDVYQSSLSFERAAY